MSIPDSSSQHTPLLKRMDVYTVLLFLSFVAIGVSVALLALEMQRYDWDIKAEKGAGKAAALYLPAVQNIAAADGSVVGTIGNSYS